MSTSKSHHLSAAEVAASGLRRWLAEGGGNLRLLLPEGMLIAWITSVIALRRADGRARIASASLNRRAVGAEARAEMWYGNEAGAIVVIVVTAIVVGAFVWWSRRERL